ncbi:MAG TPA: hypothetical protein VE172_04910 [Stackebrandtia sp.]|uniref:hypothetical protein n=1 Tax=Stackebrandtia sp. TaxID=2023065 RepID=UPI002D21F2B1|nr:hypothetical protein [Stackebrandtia sp.]HZE38134.1 hypothetical protein [Stackebrandtia sp.]
MAEAATLADGSATVVEVDADTAAAPSTVDESVVDSTDGSGVADAVESSVDEPGAEASTVVDSGADGEAGDSSKPAVDADDARREPRSDDDDADDERDAAEEADRRRADAESEAAELPIDEDVEYRDLDRDTRAGLRSLPKGLADSVGRRLVMAGRLVDVDPQVALAHALVARRLASRVAVVREAVGIVAYQAGQWQAAISELRTAQRLTGTRDHIALIADAERALGRPERAVDAYRELDGTQVADEVRIELLIVAAGARRDMGQGAASVAMLQVPELKSTADEPWVHRLRFAYADALAAEDRVGEAREWFETVLRADDQDPLGVGERLLELDGVAWLAEPDEVDPDGDGD